MIVGILKEIKVLERRVAMTPAGVGAMIHNGHEVLVEKNAGVGSGFEDALYVEAGATMVDTPAEIYAKSDMVMHVKEPQPWAVVGYSWAVSLVLSLASWWSSVGVLWA